MLVGAGTYSPSTNNEVFPIKMASEIHVIGFGEEVTIIDAQQSSKAIKMEDCEDNIISHLTITGGLSDGQALQDGGAMYLYNSSPILSHITISNNVATTGGGMYLHTSNPILDHVTISNNTADSYGGGMYLHTSNPILDHVTISNNTASWGGGMHLSNSDLSMNHVTIKGNQALQGGGMRVISSDPTLTYVTISNNTSSEGGGLRLFNSDAILTHVAISNNFAEYFGGGMWLDYSNPILTYVTISDNTADSYGGGIRLSNANPILRNVTITNNTSINGGGGMYLNSSDPSLTNSIIWNNIPEPIFTSSGSSLITYSNIEGGWEGQGNINNNPQFADPYSGDYSLTDTSLCIDTGTIIVGMEYCGDAPDMGAYEYCEEQISGDINNDGLLDILDIVIAINVVINGEYNEIIDVNDDGVNSILDIVIIINIILAP